LDNSDVFPVNPGGMVVATGSIPTFSLYGEIEDPSDTDWVHCETIQARSRIHDYRIEPHRHENLLQLLYLGGGEADLLIDGRESRLTSPAVVIVPPRVVHGYTFSADVDGTVVTLFANRLGKLVGAAEEIRKSFREARVVSLRGHEETARTIAADIAALSAEIAGRAESRLRVIEARLILILIALHRFEGRTRDSSSGKRGLTHVTRFCDLVDQTFGTHQSVDAYAARLGITSAHLNRICREHLGETALAVIHQRLIVEAKRYLTFTALNAKEIAAALGFSDPAYFARFFRQRTGLSPLSFRIQRNATIQIGAKQL
jgi:AraC family transcriptional activator of pobA